MKTTESKSKFKSLSTTAMNNVKGGQVIIRVIINGQDHYIKIS